MSFGENRSCQCDCGAKIHQRHGKEESGQPPSMEDVRHGIATSLVRLRRPRVWQNRSLALRTGAKFPQSDKLQHTHDCTHQSETTCMRGNTNNVTVFLNLCALHVCFFFPVFLVAGTFFNSYIKDYSQFVSADRAISLAADWNVNKNALEGDRV